MTQDNGASLRDRAFVPSASSQPEAVSPVPASIPSASFLRELSAAFGALEYKHVGWEGAMLAGNLADAFESLASLRGCNDSWHVALNATNFGPLRQAFGFARAPALALTAAALRSRAAMGDG